MPPAPPELSRAEWLLMNLCWKHGKTTARAIYDEAAKKKKWGYQTAKTMLDRLVDKGYLRRERLGPVWLYDPAVPRQRAVSRAIDSFASTVLDNTFAPLFVHLAKGERLDDEEIEALRRLIEKNVEETTEDAS